MFYLNLAAHYHDFVRLPRPEYGHAPSTTKEEEVIKLTEIESHIVVEADKGKLIFSLFQNCVNFQCFSGLGFTILPLESMAAADKVNF